MLAKFPRPTGVISDCALKSTKEEKGGNITSKR